MELEVNINLISIIALLIYLQSTKKMILYFNQLDPNTFTSPLILLKSTSLRIVLIIYIMSNSKIVFLFYYQLKGILKSIFKHSKSFSKYLAWQF